MCKNIETDRQTDRQADRQTEKTDTQRDRDSQRAKTLIHKNNGIGSIWTYLTASPCYARNA